MPAGAELNLCLIAKGTILGGFDLGIAAGERVGIRGRSGIGKSTLLRILAGLDHDYLGHLAHGAQRPAMVFQAPTLLPWRSIRDNIALAAPDGDGPQTLLKALGLGQCAAMFPAHLSLGMQRRAALARAMAARPDILFLDEPFASLDGESAALCHALLDSYAGTLVLVSHDDDDIRRQCSRRLTLDGQPAAITADDGL